MASFWKRRQAIIDDYLVQSGANIFNAAAFIDWLEGQPDHEAHEWFFGTSDAEAARQHRIALARRMASGLRIVAKVETKPMCRRLTAASTAAGMSGSTRRTQTRWQSFAGRAARRLPLGWPGIAARSTGLT